MISHLLWKINHFIGGIFMQNFRRIKAKAKGWKKQPTQNELTKFFKDYEKKTGVVSTSHTLELLGDDLLRLIRISRNFDCGEYGAILFSFRLGYLYGQRELSEDIRGHFERGCSNG